MKNRVLKIRTSGAAKARTAATLAKHRITISAAFARLTGGLGLISIEDAGYIGNCVSLMSDIRKLRLRPSFRIGRGAWCVWLDAKKKAVGDLYAVISALSRGTQPRYDSFLLSAQDFAEGLDAMYSIRTDLEGIPSISGQRDLSAATRKKLDWIIGIPSAVSISHIMAYRNLADAVKSAADILERGFVTNSGGDDLPLNDAAVLQLAEHLTLLSSTLAAMVEIKTDRL